MHQFPISNPLNEFIYVITIRFLNLFFDRYCHLPGQ